MSEQVKTITQTGKVVVGITGNIATGKSAIMRLARENGALTIDADHVVHEIMDTDANMQAAIAVAFGNEVRLPDGRINRRTLGKIAFNDHSALQDLEQIVHPAVRLEIARRIYETDKKFIAIEAIKLIEGPLIDICHQIWVTRCPKQRQLERLTICRGVDAETATKQIELQTPQEEKVARADVVIDTAGLMRETEAQFEMAWGRLPVPAEAPPITLELPFEGVAPALPIAETPVVKASEPEKKTADAGLKRPIPTALKKKLGRTLPGKPKPAAPPPQTTTPAPKPEPIQPQVAKAPPSTPTETKIEVRRARPSDIPSILLLIHRATEGALRMKRSDMLMALSERSYFIGQIGTNIQAVVGWNIENLVSRIDQLYFHPPEAITTVGRSVIESIEQSADQHICEIIVAFLPPDTPPLLRQLFNDYGFSQADIDKMPVAWRAAIQESQPENADFVIKVLRERVTHPM